ncbi:hypothetical protein BDV12DRAFT_206111 [Aspergillus spectabilis]
MGPSKAQENPTQVLKAKGPSGDFTLGRAQWLTRIDLEPDCLFDALCEQQRSYIGSVHDLQDEVSDYKHDVHSLEDKLSAKRQYEKDDKKKIEDLEAKLSVKWQHERDHKKKIEDPKAKIQQQEQDHKLKLATHGEREKNNKMRIADLDERLEVRAQRQKYLEDQIAELESRLAAQATVSDQSTTKLADRVETKASATSNSSATMGLPDPPMLIDGVDPKFANWRYLMDLTFKAKSDYLDTPTCRLLVTRLRSKILKPIMDVEEAFEYLGMAYHEPELRTADPADFWPTGESNGDFWNHFRVFVWNVVKFEVPEEDWNQKLHEYLQLVLKTDIGDFSSYPDSTTKELAKGIFLHMMRQQWEDTACSETVEDSQASNNVERMRQLR